MSAQDETAVDGELIGERRHLLSLAFRMLGTVADAEDAVQETYIRWYRLGRPERNAIEVPRAWLTRVASRVCLDMLGSARARRERYVGPWLPEPVPTSTFRERVEDPLDRVALDETVSTALLVVLEAMTPAERVAFVLHEQTGDLGALVTALDPAVVLRSDGGGIVSAARKPIRGADRVARFLLGVLAKRPGTEVLEQDTHDGLGFAIWREGRITGVVTLDVLEGFVTEIRMVVNPEKLRLWASED